MRGFIRIIQFHTYTDLETMLQMGIGVNFDIKNMREAETSDDN